jgi:lipoprotein-releasing system ATP-binding protein
VLRAVNRASGTAFLLVTHNLALAARCDRVIELVDGRLVSPAPELTTINAASAQRRTMTA